MHKITAFLIVFLIFLAFSNPVRAATVQFFLEEINVEVICLENVVSITDIGVESSGDIQSLEYSLDGGQSWSALEAMGLYREANFNLPHVPIEAGLIVFQLRTLVEGRMYTSARKNIPTSCGEALILGYYFENSGEPAVVTKSGDVLYNPNHELKIFVEASYAVTDVAVGVGDEMLSLDYDVRTKLWSGVVPEEYMNNGENVLEVFGMSGQDMVKKVLPLVFNSRFYVPEIEEEMYGYSIHHFDGYRWQRVDYQGEGISYPIFTLLPGKYVIKLHRENGWFHSAIFEIEERSLVSLRTPSTSYLFGLRWLEKFFLSLDVVILGSDFHVKERTFDLGENDLKVFLKDTSKDAVIMYVNRWNPWYRQTLKILENYAQDYEIILVTDENSFDYLSSALKGSSDFMTLYPWEDAFQLRRVLVYQPQIIYYSSVDGSFSVAYSLQSFVNLLNKLE